MKTFILFLGLAACTNPHQSIGIQNSFDKICQLFVDIETGKTKISMDPSQRAAALSQSINELTLSQEARTAVQSLTMADPQEKYAIFKTGAEATLKESWECPAMQKFFGSSATP